MMLLKLKPDSDIPIYMQIREQIIKGIADGELSSGEQLPPLRQLAADLGVNLHTVNKAYLILQNEGYVNVQGRKGAIIAAPPSYNKAYTQTLSIEIEKLFTEARSRGVPQDVLRDITDTLLAHYDAKPDTETKSSNGIQFRD
ncbi:MAG: GntR family transcriptional regulator [Clostridiales Family XIII bacterium]|jgi:DNA-binding transcriptional regulator YhcF (GntR family)|nr:GntR family transcriptional regulator [Clostridiales Family XIII bacterium]